jgi:hypothetical protein
MLSLRALLLALVLSAPRVALADKPASLELRGQRILLSDVYPEVQAALASTDLGPAPPPGRSVLLSYADIAIRLRSLGIAASQLNLPKGSVRVESKARVYPPSELEALVRGDVEAALPVGTTLVALHVEHDLVLSPNVKVGLVRLGDVRARAGRAKEIAMVELLWGSEIVGRVPVVLDLRVADMPENIPIPRGTVISLIIARGNIEVSVLAETLAAARPGESVMLRAQATKKILNAKLVSPTRAEVAL